MFKTLVEIHTSVPSTCASVGEGPDGDKKKKKYKNKKMSHLNF